MSGERNPRLRSEIGVRRVTLGQSSRTPPETRSQSPTANRRSSGGAAGRGRELPCSRWWRLPCVRPAAAGADEGLGAPVDRFHAELGSGVAHHAEPRDIGRLDRDEVLRPAGAGVLHYASRQGHAGGSQGRRMVVDPSGRAAGVSKPVCHSFRPVGTGSSRILGESFAPFGAARNQKNTDKTWALCGFDLSFYSASSTFTLSSETRITNLLGMRHVLQGLSASPGPGGTGSHRLRHGRPAAACLTRRSMHTSHETGRVSAPRGQKGATPPGVSARCLVRTDAAFAAVRSPGCALPSVMRGASYPWTTNNTG